MGSAEEGAACPGGTWPGPAPADPLPAAGRRWRPSRLADTTVGQLAGLVVGGLLATLLIVLGLLFWLHPNENAVLRGPHSDALQVASLIEAMRGVPAADRWRFAAGVHTPGLRVREGGADAVCRAAPRGRGTPRELKVALERLMPRDARVFVRRCAAGVGDQTETLEVIATDLGMIFDLEFGTGYMNLGFLLRIWMPLIESFLVLFVLVGALSVWAVLRIIGPLQRLAAVVERFGRDVEPAPMAEEGPREIRLAARAFNEMQERVAAAVRDRTRMLAAISHDLRTPITRMRLRVELEPPAQDKASTLRDLDLMQRMISSALEFLRGTRRGEPVETVDLRSMLDVLCEDMATAGRGVRLAAGETVQLNCRPDALSRAVANLIENACRYGGGAMVVLGGSHDEVHVDVLDRGPGIAGALKDDAVRPFVRLDAARSMEVGGPPGVGLGLAIVADIARSHGGTLRLLDRPGGGLCARLVLPRHWRDRTSGARARPEA